MTCKASPARPPRRWSVRWRSLSPRSGSRWSVPRASLADADRGGDRRARGRRSATGTPGRAGIRSCEAVTVRIGDADRRDRRGGRSGRSRRRRGTGAGAARLAGGRRRGGLGHRADPRGPGSRRLPSSGEALLAELAAGPPDDLAGVPGPRAATGPRLAPRAPRDLRAALPPASTGAAARPRPRPTAPLLDELRTGALIAELRAGRVLALAPVPAMAADPASLAGACAPHGIDGGRVRAPARPARSCTRRCREAELLVELGAARASPAGQDETYRLLIGVLMRDRRSCGSCATPRSRRWPTTTLATTPTCWRRCAHSSPTTARRPRPPTR